MNRDLITDIGLYCKNIRLNQNVSLKDFAILNNDNLKNIWAFENNKVEYNKAIQELKRKYPYLKIHNGNIQEFFKNTPKKFDIVYHILDFKAFLFIVTNSSFFINF